MADQNAQLMNCVGVRLASSSPQLAALQYYSDSVIWHWNVKNEYAHEGYVHTVPIHSVHLSQIDEDIGNARMIQFLLASGKDTK